MGEWYRNVELAETRADLLDVCRLRYHVYVDELKRDNYSYLDKSQHTLEDPLDGVDGVVNLLVRAPEGDGRAECGFLAGCARIHAPVPEKYRKMFGIGDAALFPGAGPRDFAFFSRFVVAAAFRGRNGATDSIYERCYVQARRMGAKYLLLNCSPSLAMVYERKGWVRYRPTHWDEDMGMQLPMCLPMEDTAFLGTFGSFSILPPEMRTEPPVDGSGPEGVPKGEWLSHTLGRLEAPMVSLKFCTPSIVQNFLLQRISREDMNRVPLFNDTTSEERMAFLRSAGGCVPVIGVKAGDSISLVGEVRNEAFLVLSGSVRAEYRNTLLGQAGPGALLGEKAFLSGAKRAVTVRAEEDVEMLVISRITFMKAMKGSPEVAVKFLFNVACSLSRSYSENMERMNEEIEALQKARSTQAAAQAATDADGLSSVTSEILRDSTFGTQSIDRSNNKLDGTGATEAPLARRRTMGVKKSSLLTAVEAEGTAVLSRMSLTWDSKASLNAAHKDHTFRGV